MEIAPVPATYNGIRYRSRLEADWAAMFTFHGVYFQYEPEAFTMPSGAVYDCDFFLPTLKTYCEAKGPHNERLWKPQELAAALVATEFPRAFQVVILRAAGPQGDAAWELAGDGRTPLFASCESCRLWGFTDDDEWSQRYCRRCWSNDVHGYHSADEDGPHIPMVHAPRQAA